MPDDDSPAVAFDPIVHAPARLRLLMVLAARPVATFHELTGLTGLTAGNIASHVKTLEGAGYVETFHRFIDLKPRARYRWTDTGRAALAAYLEALRGAVTALDRLLDP